MISSPSIGGVDPLAADRVLGSPSRTSSGCSVVPRPTASNCLRQRSRGPPTSLGSRRASTPRRSRSSGAACPSEPRGARSVLRGAPQQADRDLRDRPQTGRARLAPAVQGRGLPLRRADHHAAQAAPPAAQGRRQRPRISLAGETKRKALERRFLEEAERNYRNYVATKTARGAGAATGDATVQAPMQQGLHSPRMPALLVRGQPRQESSRPGLDALIRMGAVG
jgi:hypothetical protein